MPKAPSVAYVVDTQQDAAELALRAERRMGELLRETVPRRGGSKYREGTLDKLAVTKKESSQAQKLAATPEPEFERRLALLRDAQERLSVGAMLRRAGGVLCHFATRRVSF